MTICITLPSLAVIAETISGIWRSCDFSKWRRRRLEFLNFPNYSDRKRQEGQTASVYKISCRSVKQMLRYGDFSIFQDGDRRHLGFSKFQNCNGRKVQEGQTASLCQISCRSAKPLRRYNDFFIFQDGGRPILDFEILETLTVGTLKRAKLHYEIWRFLDFPKWPPLPSWILKNSNF